MGLFSRLTLRPPEKATGDDDLLFHCMVCMAAADGILDDSEVATIEAFFLSLPEFRNKDFGIMLEASNKLIAEHGGVTESIRVIAGIQSEAVRKKAFVLAVDIALSSGDVDHTEDAMLDEMQVILGIDDALATQIAEVLALKYAR
jgi:tellurite resistance protein